MQPRAKPSFDWQEPTGKSERKPALLQATRAAPELPEPRIPRMRNWLFAAIAFGALAYLILTANLITILIIAAMFGAT